MDTAVDETVWPPFCGVVYPINRTAGDPVVCTKLTHRPDEQHHNEETGWSWWSDD